MIVVIEELIKVGAVFGGGKVQPKWFFWRGRKYTIQGDELVPGGAGGPVNLRGRK
jgi:hypothetical protein